MLDIVNNVVRLEVTEIDIDPFKPFIIPDDTVVNGTGFVIDKHLILTNSHVVENANIRVKAIFPHLGNRRIKCKVYNICHERDLALVKIEEDINIKPLQLGNYIDLFYGDEIYTIGYPLGSDRVKVTSGIVSGFENNNYDIYSRSKYEDSYERDPTCIQITAPLNPGNSGGPLVRIEDDTCRVVGINSAGYVKLNDIGYSIVSTLFDKKEFSKPGIIYTPTWDLDWMRWDDGIYIRYVYPDSTTNLEQGDVINEIRFGDYIAKINDYGDVKVKGIDRILTISELADLIPIGSKVVVRLEADKEVSFINRYIESSRLRYIYPVFESYKYIILGGVCWMDLTMNHIDQLDCPLITLPEDRFDRKVIATHVFGSDSDIQKLDIMDTIDGKKIYSIDDIKYHEGSIITTTNHKILYIDKDMLDRDKRISEKYKR
jgi:hypothetical protein